jgi:hypothetical protein
MCRDANGWGIAEAYACQFFVTEARAFGPIDLDAQISKEK